MKSAVRNVIAGATLAVLTGCVAAQQKAYQDGLIEIEKKTGLKEVKIPNTTRVYLGKTHRGYGVLYSRRRGTSGDGTPPA